MTVLAVNKKARFDYEIQSTFEAGLVLLGHEVKSIKTGHVSLKGSYVTIKQPNNLKSSKNPELFLINAHIPLYKHASQIKNHDPLKPRKLLLHKKEIDRLIGKKQEQGLTFVPIKLYTKRGLIKLLFGIGRGKKKHDKREDIKRKDLNQKLRTLTKTKFA
ncbi:SsrA-binding protein SmpB [Candidatus Parcubacteria bacterium]|nr:SsrA-binding protein SmpB [Candidatus Parcubacteria bacterium]